WWVWAAAALAGLAVFLFVGLKIGGRLIVGQEPTYTLPKRTTRLTTAFESAIPKAFWGGVAAVVILIGVPNAIAGVSAATVANQPTPAVASLTAQLGFASPSICKTAAERSFADSKAAALRAGRQTFDYG